MMAFQSYPTSKTSVRSSSYQGVADLSSADASLQAFVCDWSVFVFTAQSLSYVVNYGGENWREKKKGTQAAWEGDAELFCHGTY